MNQKVKSWISFVLRFGLSGGVLWFLFHHMNQAGTLAELAELVKTADVKYVFYAFIPFVFINGFLLVRLRIFIKALELDIPWMNMTRYTLIGLFGNLFMPSAIGGDVIKIVGMCTNAEEKPKIVAAVLLDRLSGFASMVLISTLSLLIGFRYLDNPILWVTVALMAILLTGLGCVLFNETLYRLFCHVFYFFPKVKKAVMQMHYDIALLKDHKIAIVKAVALSCCGQILLALTFFWLARALHQEVSFFYFIIFTPIACVASSFPSIGGLGFREGVLEYLLVQLGVAKGIGISIGLLDFLFMVIVGLFGWMFFMLTKDQKK